MSNIDPNFVKEYHVENRANPKMFPDPVSEHDIKLLEQMGAEVLVDRVLKVVYILNDKRPRRKRSNTGRKVF